MGKKTYYMSSAKWSSYRTETHLLVLLIKANNFCKLIMVLFSYNFNFTPELQKYTFPLVPRT